MRYTASAVISATPIDLNWTGRPRSIAAALLRSGSANAIVDPGPSSTLATLRQQLALQGLGFSDLQAIFLTHIHLDHAGATGSLLKENPDLQVFVHSRGAPHIVDPGNLLHSAGRLYGKDMGILFGDFLPVPELSLRILSGGELLPFGDDTLRVLYTPGHASHHVTYFDPAGGTAFVGDTAGICFGGHPLVLPAAPPPDINMEIWNASLDAIERLNPQRLFLTHFGFSPHPVRHLANFRVRLRQWSELTAKLLAEGREDSEAMQEFIDRVSAEAETWLAPVEAEHFRFNAQFPLSWMGLARYHRKRLTAAK